MNACSTPMNMVIGNNKTCLICNNCFTVTDSKRIPDNSDPEPLRPISYRFKPSTPNEISRQATTIIAKKISINVWIFPLSGNAKLGFTSAVTLSGQKLAPHNFDTFAFSSAIFNDSIVAFVYSIAVSPWDKTTKFGVDSRWRKKKTLE